MHGGEHGPDLEHRHGQRLAVDELCPCHAGAEYASCSASCPAFHGRGCPVAPVATPQRTEVQVPAGSVAIATGLTAIYPWESPGGWHLLGRCPAPLFHRAAPALLAAGVGVNFEPIDEPDLCARSADCEQDGSTRSAGASPGGTLMSIARDPRAGRLVDPGCRASRLSAHRRTLGGALAPQLMRIANRLVGNDEGRAGNRMLRRWPESGGARGLGTHRAHQTPTPGCSATAKPRLAPWRSITLVAGDELRARQRSRPRGDARRRRPRPPAADG